MSGVAMGTRYSHVTLEERCRLRGLMEIGLSPGVIARRLGRDRAMLHRAHVLNIKGRSYRLRDLEDALKLAHA
jgi:IS30 family transposase